MDPLDSGESVSVSGQLYGGSTPIANATINLYMAGSNGYGKPVGTFAALPATTPPVLLATTTSAPYTGNFNFTHSTTKANPSGAPGTTWACPADGSDPLIYILAVGGNTNGPAANSNNPAAVQAVSLGQCSSVTTATRVFMSEVSTAAFAAAFGQFMYPGDGSTSGSEAISSNGAYLTGTQTSQSAVALHNAFLNLEANLLEMNSNTPFTSVTHAGTATSVANVVVTATQELGKLNTIANILVACVNSANGTLNSATTPVTSPNCAELFDGAAPPILASATASGGPFPPAIDILGAALYMQINPAGLTASGVNTVKTGGVCNTVAKATTNVDCLYGLVNKIPAFSPTVTKEPSDWSIGITFSAGGGTPAGTSGNNKITIKTLATTNTCPGGGPFLYGPIKGAVDASGNLFWIGGAGIATSGTTGQSNLAEMSPIGQPLLCLGNSSAGGGGGIAIDPTGNVWAAFGSSTTAGIVELPAASPTALVNWSTPDVPTAVSVDGLGNILISANTTPVTGSLFRINDPGTATSGTVNTLLTALGTSPTLLNVGVDYNGNVWMAGEDTKLYGAYVAPDAGSTLSISKWAAAVATGGSATYTFTSPSGSSGANSTTLAVGDQVTLSGTGFANNANAKSPNPVLNNLKVTVTSVTTTTFKAVIPSTSAAIATQTESGDVATLSSTDFRPGTSSSGGNSYGLAVDSLGNIYEGTTCCNNVAFKTVEKFAPSTNGTSTYVSTSTAPGQSFLGGLNGVRSIGVDGAGNLWVGNEWSSTGNASAVTFYPIVELATKGTNTFTALSPNGQNLDTTTTCTTTVGCPTGGGFLKSDVQLAHDVDIDPSGNVWVLNSGPQSNDADGTTIVQFVGTAVPVVTPLSPGTSLATSKLGTKP